MATSSRGDKSFVCFGCLRPFTRDGYARHVAQTTNFLCKRANQLDLDDEDNAHLSATQDIEMASVHDSDEEELPKVFAGDLFRDDYDDRDLG